jgi:hypothetical protein
MEHHPEEYTEYGYDEDDEDEENEYLRRSIEASISQNEAEHEDWAKQQPWL